MRPPAARTLASLLLLALPACSPAPDAARPPPPNIVLVLADDLGWADLGVQGATGFATPHLDRLAAEGCRFTDFYVAQAICSASRAALLTGCYPNRIGIHGALGPDSPKGLARDETTLAEICRAAGYATAAFGKWHLGHHQRFLPTAHGFDSFYGIPYSNDMGPLHAVQPDSWGDLPLLDGEHVIGLNTDQRRFTADFTDRAVQFIEGAVADGQPFFVYLAQPMPHVPLHVSAEFAERTTRGLYGDVLEELDASVGRVLATLARLGVDERTLVIFLSDNGPWLSYGDHGGSAGPLREGKGTTFEGGVRVPCLLRWPGVIPAGRVCAEPAMTIDLLPTLAALLDVPLPGHPIDGRDIWPLVVGQAGATSPQEAYLFWYAQNELQALRSGRWKLHFPHAYGSMAGQVPGAGGRPGSYAERRTRLALYDLLDDPGEQQDVAAGHPDVVARLSALADEWRTRLGDRLVGAEGSEARAPGWVR